MREEKKEEVVKKKVSERKGKKPHKNQPLGKKYEHYKLSGDSLKKDKMCPRCGAAIFLANHGNRLYCGKCHYTSFGEKP